MDEITVCPDPKERIPEDSVVEGEIRLISYIDSDSMSEMFAFSVSEGFPTSRTVGLLDIVKAIVQHDILHEYIEEDE